MLVRRLFTGVEFFHQQAPAASRLMRINLALGVVGLVAFVFGLVAVQLAVLVAMVIVSANVARMAARSAHDSRERAGWNWFALSFLFFSLYFVVWLPGGEQLNSEFNLRNGTSRVITLMAYLCCLGGLAFAVRVPRGFLARILLDIAVVLAGGAVIVAEILQHTSVTVTAPDLTTRLLFRPLLDLVIVSLIAIALAAMPRTARLYPALVRGMAALLLLFVGHLGSSIAVLQDQPTAPAWVYVFHTLGAILLGAAAFRYVLGQHGADEAQPAALVAHNPLTHSFWFHLGNAVVPYTIAMSAATLLFIRALRTGSSDLESQLPLLGALAFIGVGGIRHVLSHAENRTLYRNMSELNHSLEVLVEQRTAEVVRRNEELEAVHKVATVSAESMDLEAVLHAVAEQLTHVVGASMCMIHERTSDGVQVVARYERGGTKGTSRLYDPGVNLLKLPRNELEPIGQRSSIIKRWDLGNNGTAAAILDYHGSSVALVVPMVARDQTVGIAEIYRTSADPFSESDVSLVEAVTTQAALATENARAFGHVTFAANHDPVTGLLNHRALHEEMSGLFERALSTGRPLTVVMMDLNLFKEFNDRYGHQAGDAVLTDIAHAIIECVPSSSIAARYGGDEFTVVVPDFPPENAAMFISAIRDRVALIQDRYGFVGAGFGIAAGIASFPEDGAALSGLIAQADERMYDDKRRLKGSPHRRKSGISFTGYGRDSAGIPIDTNL